MKSYSGSSKDEYTQVDQYQHIKMIENPPLKEYHYKQKHEVPFTDSRSLEDVNDPFPGLPPALTPISQKVADQPYESDPESHSATDQKHTNLIQMTEVTEKAEEEDNSDSTIRAE